MKGFIETLGLVLMIAGAGVFLFNYPWLALALALWGVGKVLLGVEEQQ